jgi:hypothetical protein
MSAPECVCVLLATNYNYVHSKYTYHDNVDKQ